MSHVTPSEFAALQIVAAERARIVAVLAPRAPSIAARLQGPATTLRPSVARAALQYCAGLCCALLAGLYLPAPVVRLISLFVA